jgi:hypothetical protein
LRISPMRRAARSLTVMAAVISGLRIAGTMPNYLVSGAHHS